MKKKNKAYSSLFIATITIPTISSIFAVRYLSLISLIIIMAGVLLMLRLPIFKHRENLWMFVIATFATIPVNIILVKHISESFFFDYGGIAIYISKGFVIYAVLFAVEQIALGIITRFFYRKQYKLF